MCNNNNDLEEKQEEGRGAELSLNKLRISLVMVGLTAWYFIIFFLFFFIIDLRRRRPQHS